MRGPRGVGFIEILLTLVAIAVAGYVYQTEQGRWPACRGSAYGARRWRARYSEGTRPPGTSGGVRTTSCHSGAK